MKSLGEQEQQQKLKIYINCLIFISNRCMTYLSKSWTPNDSIYSFTHCKTVMKLTISNGLSLQTFISQCMTSCNWQFQMGGPLPDLPIFIYYGYLPSIYMHCPRSSSGCSSMQGICSQLTGEDLCWIALCYADIFDVVVFNASMLNWLGGPSAFNINTLSKIYQWV